MAAKNCVSSDSLRVGSLIGVLVSIGVEVYIDVEVYIGVEVYVESYIYLESTFTLLVSDVCTSVMLYSILCTLDLDFCFILTHICGFEWDGERQLVITILQIALF